MAGAPPEGSDLEEIMLRYLGAFGPASVDDSAWSGLKALRDVFDGQRDRLVTFRDDRGIELFDLPDAPRPEGGTPPPGRFLSEYDNLYLSHADRRRVVRKDDGRRHPGPPLRNALLVDGFVGGLWRLEQDRETATLHVHLLDPAGAARTEALTDEGERLAALAAPGRNARVTIAVAE